MHYEKAETNIDQDPSQELRESLEIMGSKELTKARAEAIKGLVETVWDHPSAQEVPGKSGHNSHSPMEITLPEAGVTIKVDALDQGEYTFNPNYRVAIADLTSDDTSVQPKELETYDKPLFGDDHSLRDMQAVVEDVVAMQTLQEQLTTLEPSVVDQLPQS